MSAIQQALAWYKASSPSTLLTGIIAYYKLDESSGNATDSVWGFTGTNNSVTYAAGKINNWAVFNGSSSYLSGSGINIASSDFTFSAWFKVAAGTNPMEIITIGDTTGNTRKDFYMRVRKDNNTIGFWMYWDDYEVANTVTNGTYYHLLCTFNNTTKGWQIFLNNTSIWTKTFWGAFTGGTNFNIGKAVWSAANYMNWTIDELGIWNRVLNSTERASLYNSGSWLQYPF